MVENLVFALDNDVVAARFDISFKSLDNVDEYVFELTPAAPYVGAA